VRRLPSPILTKVLGAEFAGATTAVVATSAPTAATATTRKIFLSSIVCVPFFEVFNHEIIDWPKANQQPSGCW
jgi:hypothetical protein